MKPISGVLVNLLAVFMVSSCENNCVPYTVKPANTTEQFMVQILENYDRHRAPLKGESTRVQLGIYINALYSISEQTMDYALNIYLRMNWTDSRLAFTPTEEFGNVIRIDEYADKVWVPDVFFRNEKVGNYHSVTVPNRLMKLDSTGSIWYVTKISLILKCDMELVNYPMDVQTCPLMMESFGNNNETMHFTFLDPPKNPVESDPNVTQPQFNHSKTTFNDCTVVYTTGAYPCLKIEFHLHRRLGFYLTQVYIPTIMIVILSWIGFWINVDAIPARVSLGLLTVLTMTTQSASARSSLPKVSYIKAIDVWMCVCLVFVFASLLEFAVVNVYSRREIPRPTPGKSPMRSMIPGLSTDDKAKMCIENPETPEKKAAYIRDPEGKQKARYVDRISRYLFPLAFAVFLLVYWVYYGTQSQASSR